MKKTLLFLLFAVGLHAADTVAGNLIVQKQITLLGDLTPTTVSSDQNNYNPTNLGSSLILRLATDASRNLTGISGGTEGKVFLLWNVGANNLVLKNQSSSSTAANRLALGADLTLGADSSVILVYDSTSSRWRAVGGPSAGGGGGSASWGGITGTLSSQTDLQVALDAKLSIALTTDTSTTFTDAAGNVTVTLNNASPVAYTLPALAGVPNGKSRRVKNLGAGVVTVSGNGAETIFTSSAVSSFQLKRGQSVDLTATPSYWIAQ